MVTVKATADVQFLPKGDGFNYAGGGTAEEKKKLKRVLAACTELGKTFNQLLPPTKQRKWWKDNGGLTFTATGNQVPLDEVVGQVNDRLKAAKLTNKQLKAIRSKLSKKLQMAIDGGGLFPASLEKTSATGDSPALEFSVMDSGTRTYYAMPDGKVKCCVTMPLAMNQQPIMVTDTGASSNDPDGDENVDGDSAPRLDVVLAVHFRI